MSIKIVKSLFIIFFCTITFLNAMDKKEKPQQDPVMDELELGVYTNLEAVAKEFTEKYVKLLSGHVTFKKGERDALVHRYTPIMRSYLKKAKKKNEQKPSLIEQLLGNKDATKRAKSGEETSLLKKEDKKILRRLRSVPKRNPQAQTPVIDQNMAILLLQQLISQAKQKPEQVVETVNKEVDKVIHAGDSKEKLESNQLATPALGSLTPQIIAMVKEKTGVDLSTQQKPEQIVEQLVNKSTDKVTSTVQQTTGINLNVLTQLLTGQESKLPVVDEKPLEKLISNKNGTIENLNKLLLVTQELVSHVAGKNNSLQEKKDNLQQSNTGLQTDNDKKSKACRAFAGIAGAVTLILPLVYTIINKVSGQAKTTSNSTV